MNDPDAVSAWCMENYPRCCPEDHGAFKERVGRSGASGHPAPGPTPCRSWPRSRAACLAVVAHGGRPAAVGGALGGSLSSPALS